MSKTCVGCGAILQDENKDFEGYVLNTENDYCLRCFKMRNYGQYEINTKSNEEYIKILKEIGQKKDLVLYIVDLLSPPKDLKQIRDYLVNNRVVLVLNKRDALPLSISDEKLLDYFWNENLSYTDIVLISTSKNYNLDVLYEVILERKNSDNVYIVGNTNAGKSSLIDKLIYNYTKSISNITISPMPSTTLNEIVTDFLDFHLIDTPGLFDEGNILNYLSEKEIKNLTIKKEIKPITYQAKENEIFILDNLLRIEYQNGDKNSFTFFVPNNVNLKRIHSKNNLLLTDLPSQTIDLNGNEDLCINGLGFIKITKKAKLVLYTYEKVEIYKRKSLI